jgi:hypothetical protein
MGFLVVRINESDDIVVVPVHWYDFTDNTCAWPNKNPRELAKRQQVLSSRWPRYGAKVISSHGIVDYVLFFL